MKSNVILMFSLIVIALFNTSFRWPVDNGRITSTFCESRWDHFHDGVDMVSPDDRVYPVAPGKLLFFWDRSIFPLEEYPGGGNYKILAHAGNIYSIYMHLEDGVISRESYGGNDLLGIAGNSGRSFSKHLHFSIINIQKGISVNPMRMLPKVIDQSGPEVGDMALKIGDKYVILRDNADIRLTRHYPLLFRIQDSITGRERLGIYRLKVLFNDEEVFNVNFKSLASSGGGLTVMKKGFNSLFDQKGYYKIEGLKYREGANTIHIVTADYAGNVTEKNYTLQVKLDLAEN